MAEVIGSVLAKITSSLAEQAISTLSKEFSSVKKLTLGVEKIRKELHVMNELLRDLGDHNVGKQDICKEWIGEVRKLAYIVEDVMDKYSYHALQWAGEGCFNKLIKSSKYVLTWHGLCEDIARIEGELNHISEIRQRWLHEDLRVRSTTVTPRDAQGQRTQGGCFNDFVEDRYLVGMDQKRNELVTWLNSNEKTSKVMIVSGIGGLGKTNLVWNVYEKQRRENHFDAYAWIVVSETYSRKDFLRHLIRQVKGEKASENGPSHLDSSISCIELELEKALKEKGCMVVLDDVWDDGPYNMIHDFFQAQQSASRIIITTRKRDDVLAARALVRHSLVFEPLNDNDARNLFCKYSSLEMPVCSQGFSEVVETVAKTCGNHPLAIISIAKKLCNMPRTERDWQEKCNEPRSLLAEDHVRGVLHRTYYNKLLDKDIQNCFLYCSLFPEGYPIRRECIIRMWVAEGLVTQREQNTPEVVAEGYMRKMIQHSMIRPVDTDEFGEVITCRVDPILRILALSISEDKQFGVANDQCRMEQSGDSVRRLSACRARDKLASNTKCPHLRTLIAVGAYTATPDKLCWISEETMYLVVLELQDSSIDTVPASVGNLFNLRYLGLRCTKVKSLPKSIKKLINLQTLDLKSTCIEKLPGGIIRKLNRLKHLFADRFTEDTGPGPIFSEGVAVPKGLPCLLELQTLETIEASIELGKQLEKLEQLTSLGINNLKASHCKDLFPTLLKKGYLSSLHVSANDSKEKLCLEDVKITSMELQKLFIRGCLAEGILRNFIFSCQTNKLKYLNLNSCQFEDDPLHLLAEHLPELTCLSLTNVEKCKPHLVLPESKFRFLNTLVLKGMTSVQHLTIRDGAIPKVEALVLEKMPNLEKVPSGLNSLRALKKLWLLGLASEFRTEWHNKGWHERLSGILDIRVEE